MLPLVAASPTIHLSKLARLILGVAPFTGLLGFITPMLVDRFSRGNPGRAGTAYATNIVGCILGPLVAGFALLPFISERWTLVILTVPWLIVALAPLRPAAESSLSTRLAICSALVMAVVLVAVGRGYVEAYPDGKVLRDSTATVIATGSDMEKDLLVNGFGMTNLTPITKLMAHLPLAFLDRTSAECASHMFWHGNDVSIAAFVGNSRNCSRTCAQRPRSCSGITTAMVRRSCNRRYLTS